MNASEKVSTIPGNKAYRTWRWLKSPYAFLDECHSQIGATFNMSLPGMGRVLVTGDPNLIAETARNKSLIGGRGTQALRPVLGENSLIVIEGDRHRRHRRSIAPSFSADSASEFDALTHDICREVIADQSVGSVISLQATVRSISLRVIIRVLFGDLPEDRERHLESVVEKLMGSFRQPAVLFVKALHWNFGRFSPWGRFLANRAALNSFIADEIKARKRAGSPGNTLIDRLITRQGHGEFDEPDAAIIEELTSLLLFGHDTTAATMAWVFHHVHQDPAHANELRSAAITSDSPTALFKACIKESQRLCPVVVHLTRVATESTSVGGISIGEGESVLPCMYLAQRDPEIFAEPGTFLPSRFLNTARVPAWTNFPFGFGNRKCVGATFAMRQMEVILFAFMRYARLESTNEQVRPVREMLLIVPNGGGRLEFCEHLR